MSSQVRTLSSLTEIAEIADAWDALALTSGCPIDSVAWCRNACLHMYTTADQINIVTIWDAENLVAIAPLILTRGPNRRYEVPGSTALYEPMTLIANSSAAMDGLALAIASLRYPVALARMIDAYEFKLAFARCAQRMGLTFYPKVAGSPYIELRGGWDAYYESLPSRLKNVLRRGQRQLTKLGSLETQFVRPDAATVKDLLTQALEIELRSWKGRAGSAVLLRADLREFFFHYAADLANRNELLVSFLRLNGAVVAMQIANISHETYWQLKIGYDERFAKQLVGLQLQLETIRWSCQQSLRRFEFLGTTEPWIRAWTDMAHDYHAVHFYPFNASGLLALVRNTVLRIRGKLVRGWRPRAKLASENSLR